MEKLLCYDCKGVEPPDYKKNEEVEIVCIGYCSKCGCGVYTVKNKMNQLFYWRS